MFSHFFIDRPIFATVISVVFVIVGVVSAVSLPVAQFPDIAPPTVQVTASFPGANSQTVAETVATVIEQEVNGVENMLYMSSSSTNAGQYTLTVTFNTGTDLDQAQVLVQNRVAIAEPRLPSEVQRLGVTTKKSAPDILLGVNLVSPNGQYDQLYMSNYATRFVRDRLARLDGVGDIATLGARDFSMRVWLDVDQLAARGIAVDDVLAAISEQNVQVAAGRVGQPPDVTGVAFDYALNTKGRLLNAAEFEQIVVRTGEDGALTRLVDVARIELGAENYDVSSTLDGEPTVLMAVFQRPGSNALSTADGVYDELDAIAAGAPEFAGDDPGLAFEVVYDTTRFVKQSINDVVVSLLQAVGLVFLVTLIFLQSWRTTVIPMVAVPVSLVGTFGVMQLFGFSLNNLSLFGLVLAIGVVTDDAVVITEAVVTKIKDGLAPKQAAREAMSELFAAVIATSLVLLAVFVPTAFVPGISGQFYQQFALTIAAATVISLVNALTLTPAYCGVLLKPADAKPDPIERVMNVTLGWFFNIFNAGFAAASRTFGVVIAGVIRLSFVVMCVYGGLLYLAYLGFSVVPAGFIPQQDKGYLIYNAALPDGASIERTEAVAEKIDAIIGSTDGVANVLQIPGYSLFASSNVSNFTSGFIVLDPFEDRVGDPTLSADAIMNRLSQRMRAEVRDAGVAVFGAPPVSGIGTGSGFKLQIQDREGKGSLALQDANEYLQNQIRKEPGYVGTFSTFTANQPQLYVDIDREKTKAAGMSLDSVFNTLQVFLGSSYVNDFTAFGRNWRVYAQADAPFRESAEDIGNLRVTLPDGKVAPLRTLAKIEDIAGPAIVTRYNLYASADLNGITLPFVSSGDIIETVEQIAADPERGLPDGFGYEWTELTLQQKLAGNTAVFVFALAVVFVFLILAAQYESWSLPIAIILIVPVCLTAAIAGVFIAGGVNDIFTQIGLTVLVALSAKNAILVVEFAKQRQDEGLTRVGAAVDAAKLRLRPILMTAASFILGVLPLLTATGAGAEMRQALGLAVFSGMLGVTVFGLFLTPVFYVLVMWATGKGGAARS